MTTTRIETSVAYVDGSGMPTVIVVDGVRFACDWTASRSINCLDQGSMLRGARKRVVAIVRRTFDALCDSMGDEWKARRAEMYS